MSERIVNDQGLDIIFREARTHNTWAERPVSYALMQAAYDLMKWGPTSANCSPARFVFIESKSEKERLLPFLSGNNKEKTMAAPCCVIIAYDTEFYDKLPTLFPHANAKSWFEGNDKLAMETGFRNGSLQGAYFLIAARSLGLDCGPMSGFDSAGVDREFFGGSTWRSNFLCNIGYGTESGLFPRSPRLTFEEACRII